MNKRQRAILLIVLSLCSVFFAEIIAGSMPFPLLKLWGYFVVIPLYGLHVIVLLYIIIHFTKGATIPFRTLYFAGMLFGLYEAYITKVLWIGFSDDPYIVLGIGLIEYLVLIFFWHPVFSFIIPVAVFERWVLSSTSIYDGLPRFIQRIVQSKIGRISFVLVVALFGAVNGTFPTLVLSMLSMLLPMFVIMVILEKKNLLHQFTLQDVLPSKKSMYFIFTYFFGLYLFGLFFLDFGAITIANQIPIWISYLLYGGLFYQSLQKSINRLTNPSQPIPIKTVFLYILLMITAGTVFTIILPFEATYSYKIIIAFLLWTMLGFYLFVYSLYSLKKTP